MTTNNRMVRVNELLKREIGNIIERFLVSDIKDGLLTITAVKTHNDLRTADVYASFLGSEEAKKNAFKLLRKKRVMIQQEMARNVTLKYTPCLTFVNDTLPESADKLHQLLDSLDIDEDTE